jgi:hypothetical protein
MSNNYGSNGGQAAGRDINNVNLHLGPPKPESQLQVEFAQLTGIWCPKPAREWLESLMEHHRFTARELVVSWKAGSIGWNADKDTKRVITPWIEAVFAYGIAGLVGIYFLAVAWHTIWGNGADQKWGMAVVYGTGAMYLGMCWMANRFMLWPRRVALRIKRLAE